MLGAGVHQITHDAYLRDELDPSRPSLNRSVLKVLLDQSPAHARDRHPRLTTHPDFAWPATDAMKIGSVAHAILLGAGAKYVVFNPADFLTAKGTPCETLGCKEAQEAIARARAEGKVDISSDRLSKAFEVACAMKTAIAADYPRWSTGISESTLVFEYRLNNQTFILCRAKPDHMIERCVCVEDSAEHVHMFDPKCTGKSANDAWVDRTAASDGWDIQDAFYTIGAEKTFAVVGSECRFTFIVGETYPPYDTRFVTLSDTWKALARHRVDEGANIFGRCVDTGEWPGRARRHIAEVPSWLIASDDIQVEE